MPNLRKCRVIVKDIEGTTHAVDVTAESLNEAVGMAIAVFRKEECASMLPEMSTAQIEVQQTTVEHTVNLQAWWKSLDRTGVAPRHDPQEAHSRIAKVALLPSFDGYADDSRGACASQRWLLAHLQPNLLIPDGSPLKRNLQPQNDTQSVTVGLLTKLRLVPRLPTGH